MHNHPENEDGYVSFGHDDNRTMQLFVSIREMWAESDKYTHFAVPDKSIAGLPYNTAYRLGGDPLDTIENQQHDIMEWLYAEGYLLEYWREEVPGYVGADVSARERGE